ncbi:endonuclease [Streptomyces sp. H39-S7]|uniref:endonuclease n=1 Tax=Streptomyces sp. H39-S7 TaxID=3004357 RepID=UPI0022AF5708|nr:endonuclease [Streptomyces sp. H39-S7]MCZ4120997.1 endonuclease [Streptomyces sp. H39-S7]
MADELIDRLLREQGQTFADEAGIALRDKPSPLYRLLVLSLLSATRISAGIAVAAARELSEDRLRTVPAMAAAPWQQIVDALGRAHYKRYDESTATALGDGARLLHERYHGDLRKLCQEAGGDGGRIHALLQEHPRIGPVGADIFCREVQGVWTELQPYCDRATLDQAAALGLPHTAAGLARRIDSPDLTRLSAALVRVRLRGGRFEAKAHE